MSHLRTPTRAVLAVATFLAIGGSAQAASGPILVLDAQGLSSDAGSGGASTVRLRDVTQQLTSFTRGARAPKITVTVGELADAWKALGFAAAPPLATIDPRGDRRGATLVRLSQPRLRGDDLILTATTVDGSGGALAGRLTHAAASVPAKAAATTVTINAADADPDALETIDDPLTPNREGEWKQISTFIDAWGGDGDCHGDSWGLSSGSCFGKFTQGGLSPFNSSSAPWGVADWQNGTSSLTFNSSVKNTGETSVGRLRGHSPNRGGALYIDSGWLYDSNNFPVRSGTDPARTGLQGGPLSLDVEYHSSPFVNAGYTFQIDGWLWCMVGDAACHP
jgi:hypothetical protein